MSYGLLAVDEAMFGLYNVFIQVSARGLVLASLPLVGVGIALLARDAARRSWHLHSP